MAPGRAITVSPIVVIRAILTASLAITVTSHIAAIPANPDMATANPDMAAASPDTAPANPAMAAAIPANPDMAPANPDTAAAIPANPDMVAATRTSPVMGRAGRPQMTVLATASPTPRATLIRCLTCRTMATKEADPAQRFSSPQDAVARGAL